MKSKALLITGLALFLTLIAYTSQAQRGRDRDRGRGNGRYDRNDRYDRGRNWGNAYNYRSPYVYRSPYAYNYGYRPYYYRAPVFSFGNPRILIPWGGLNFYFSNGYYYRNWGGSYRVVVPPIGIRINVLPPGYRSYYYGNDAYYYYGGTYYRPHNNQYEVVEAPLGASVPEIPEAAQVKVINGQKFYEYNGTYYKEEIRDNSELWYTVVGKNGHLDTDYLNNPSQSQINPTQSQSQSQPVIGDIVDKLPADSRSIIINGQKLYLSPDNIYYQEVIEKDIVRYKVVGK